MFRVWTVSVCPKKLITWVFIIWKLFVLAEIVSSYSAVSNSLPPWRIFFLSFWNSFFPLRDLDSQSQKKKTFVNLKLRGWFFNHYLASNISSFFIKSPKFKTPIFQVYSCLRRKRRKATADFIAFFLLWSMKFCWLKACRIKNYCEFKKK